jgi:hypothetical protein
MGEGTARVREVVASEGSPVPWFAEIRGEMRTPWRVRTR